MSVAKVRARSFYRAGAVTVRGNGRAAKGRLTIVGAAATIFGLFIPFHSYCSCQTMERKWTEQLTYRAIRAVMDRNIYYVTKWHMNEVGHKWIKWTGIFFGSHLHWSAQPD
jgi:hypothetical protein